MSTRGFVQGFLQGFDKAGGTQKLSSWAGRNIADGKYYNPSNDPIYHQELQMARELGTPSARQNVVDKYGDFVDTGDISADDYFFSPAEGTPQHTQNKMNELALAEATLRLENLPNQYEHDDSVRGYQRAMSELELDQAKNYSNVYPDLLNQQVEQGALNLATNKFNLAHQKDLAPYQVANAVLGVESDDFNLEQARTQAPYKNQLLVNQVETADEQFNQLQVQGNYLEQQLQQQLDANELSMVGQRVQNEIAQMQAGLQRDLMPYEIELVKQNVMRNELQNRSLSNDIDFQEETLGDRLTNISLGNEAQRMQNELLGFDIEQQRALADLGFDVETSTPDTQFNWDHYAGTTPDGRPVMETTRGGMLALSPDGTLQDYTGQEVVGQGFDMSETKRVGASPDGRDLFVNNEGVVIHQDGSPYLDEAGNQYYARRNPFDESLTFEAFQPDFTSGIPEPEESEEPSFFEKLWYGAEGKEGSQEIDFKTESLAQRYISQYPDQDPKEIARYLLNLSPQDKEEFAEEFGVDVNRVISILNRR